MGTSPNQYQDIVLKAMAFIEANAGQVGSTADIVKNSGYSERHVENAFKKILNQSIVGALQSARIRKAKALLLQTNLGITNIAFESGFGNYANFSKVFRSKVGLTPTDFRKTALRLREIPLPGEAAEAVERREEWYKDSFPGKNLGSNWNVRLGNWRNENGSMTGEGPTDWVDFLKPLPENSRIGFELRIDSLPGLEHPNFSLWLLDEARDKLYCGFVIPSKETSTGEIRHARYGNQWNPKARIFAGAWQSVALELRDDTLRFFVDKEEAFSFRDPFPAIYSTRCFLRMQSWNCKAGIRNFTVRNLGYMPVTHPIRQGDALYNADQFEKAMDFYNRYLESGSASDAETMELRYKIGMCSLRQKAFSAAQNWMVKVVALQEEKFWAQQARLSLIELYWKTGDLESLQEHIRICMGDTELQERARGNVQWAAADFAARGFYPEALIVLRAWAHFENPGDFASAIVSRLLAEHLQAMREFDEAESVLRNPGQTNLSSTLSIDLQIDLMHLYHEAGKVRASQETRMEIESKTKDLTALARCTMQQALDYRAQEQFEQALNLLEKFPVRFPKAEPNFFSHAKIHTGLILCCMGRLEEGQKALAEANEIVPGSINSRHYLPFYLWQKNFAAAAESLLLSYRNSKELVAASAELGIKAGILHELAGMDAEAKSIFKEVSLRFPNEQVRFFGLLAKTLMEERLSLTLSVSKCEQVEEKPASSFDNTCPVPAERVRMSECTGYGLLEFPMRMPYEAHRRSEMFYLLGLLKEKRGERDSSRALFELSVKEDPALRWPAYFAKKKLRSQS